MLRPLARGLAISALALGCATAAAPAFAATTAPAPGTAECTKLVNNTSVVQNDRAAVTQAQATVTNDKAAYDAAVAQLNADKATLATLQGASQAVQPASATDPTPTNTLVTPVNGITTLTGLQSAITAAQDKVTADQAAVDKALATLNTDKAAVATAKNDLAAAIQNQTNLLCTGTTATPAPVVTPAPVAGSNTQTPGQVPATVSETVIDNEIAALNCNSTNADLQAIDRKIADRQAAHLPVAAVVSHLDGKLNQLSCTGNSAVTPQAAAQTAKDCGCLTVALNGVIVAEQQPAASSPTSSVVTSKTVIPTQSDGSTAVTSGNEVTDVPAGSAQTGAE